MGFQVSFGPSFSKGESLQEVPAKQALGVLGGKKAIRERTRESFLLWKSLAHDRKIIVKNAGELRNMDMPSRNFPRIIRHFTCYNRLLKMIAIAAESESWLLGTPDFDAHLFVHEFGKQAIKDWHFIGVLVDTKRLYQPGLFVSYYQYVKDQRHPYVVLMSVGFKNSHRFRRNYKTYSRTRDEFGMPKPTSERVTKAHVCETNEPTLP